MFKVYPKMGLQTLCRLFGYSRQAYYKRRKDEQKQLMHTAIVVDLVDEVRQAIPRIGGKKLHFMLQAKLREYDIHLGRDRFFNLLRDNDLLIKYRKRRAVTTMSRHHLRKYPNLITEMTAEAPNRLWVSDITYIKVADKWNYVIFITDAYSKKVAGFQVSDQATTAFCLQALEQALEQWTNQDSPLIHHSDRGLQYCSFDYTRKLKDNGILISMTQNGDPLENAIAERVNGIFKGDFMMDKTFKCLTEARQEIQRMVYHYNHTRPHASCDYLTPVQAHLRTGLLPRRW